MQTGNVVARIWEFPDSYVEIDGDRKPPGTYTVTPGTRVKVMTNVKNHGGTGSMYIKVVDKKTGKTIASNTYYVGASEVKFLQYEFTVDRDYDLEIQAGQYIPTTSSYIKQDSYGVWQLIVSSQPPGPGPSPPGPSPSPTTGSGINTTTLLLILLLILLAFMYMRRQE